MTFEKFYSLLALVVALILLVDHLTGGPPDWPNTTPLAGARS